MAASTTDLFTYVGDPGTATTLSSPGYTKSSDSINVGATTNFPTDTAVIFAIDEVEIENNQEVRIEGTYNEYLGIVASGTSLSNVEWLGGDGDRNYSAGSTTRVYITTAATWANRLIDGLFVEHNPDGTHSDVTASTLSTDTISEKTSATGVTVDGLLIKDGALATADSVDTDQLKDKSVVASKIYFETFVRRQNVTTNTTVGDAQILTGWTYAAGAAGGAIGGAAGCAIAAVTPPACRR